MIRMGNLSLMVSLYEGTKFRTHMPSTLFIEYHYHNIKIGAGTRTNNTRFEKLLHDFFNFILLGKGMMIRENIGRKIAKDKGNGMIMNTVGRGKSLRSGKKSLGVWI
jgi:hypothetical protein